LYTHVPCRRNNQRGQAHRYQQSLNDLSWRHHAQCFLVKAQ
jgi:hypothetical protein